MRAFNCNLLIEVVPIMRKRFKPREIVLMVLPVVGLGLFALNSYWRPAPPGSQMQQEEDIAEVALVKVLQVEAGQIKPQVVYISVAGRDATSTLVVRMARHNIVLRPTSETSWSKTNGDWEGHVIENKTGNPTSKYAIEAPVWNSATSATVNVSYIAAGLNAGGSEYPVTWNGEKWVVGKGESTWIS